MLVAMPSAHQNRHGARPRVSRRRLKEHHVQVPGIRYTSEVGGVRLPMGPDGPRSPLSQCAGSDGDGVFKSTTNGSTTIGGVTPLTIVACALCLGRDPKVWTWNALVGFALMPPSAIHVSIRTMPPRPGLCQHLTPLTTPLTT